MNSLKSLPVVIAAALAAGVAVSCGEEKKEEIAAIDDTRNYPTMLTTDVSTYVSDSGYTRYHITAPLWVMYEEADTPHWKFPDGLYLEKYDDDMVSVATFRADSATYLSSRKLWRFDGDVNMRNTDGDRFATPQLFWDQNLRRVYSDSFMHIERTERIIEGYGFESNEAMTEYTVMHPQMILPIDRMRAERDERRSAADTLSVDSVADSTAVATPPAPAAPTRATAPTRPSQRGTTDRGTQRHDVNDTTLRLNDMKMRKLKDPTRVTEPVKVHDIKK